MKTQKETEKEINTYLISVKYCPVCGKGAFGKLFIKPIESYNLKKMDNNVWDYECNKCKSEFTIKFRSLVKKLNQEKEK